VPSLSSDLAEWASLLREASTDRTTFPQRICQLCTDSLGITGVGLSMLAAGRTQGRVCATNEVAANIEDLQFSLGQGPAADAVRSGTPVLVADLQASVGLEIARWPGFLEGITAAGVRAMFAFPVRIGAISVGALDLYRDEPGDLSAFELSAALLAADAAALALLRLDTEGEDPFTENVDTGSSYRLQVHQATGMVRVQLNISMEDAFLMLRARAFSLGQPITDVATDVVQRRLRFSMEDS
jgi:hypothetical protein